MGEYRLGDVARAAGTSTRSVRTYQESGLLPSPVMRGRVGWYSEEHLGRLRMIIRLQDQGFTFAAIGVLLRAWENGRDVADVLGLESAVNRPFNSEEPVTVSAADLQERLLGQLTPAALKRLLDLKVLVEAPNGYLLTSPALVDSCARCLRAGVPLPAVLDLAEGLKLDLRLAADRVVHIVADYILRTRGPDGLPSGDALAGAAEVVNDLRPEAQLAADVWFNRGMDAAIGEFVGDLLAKAAPQDSDLDRRPEA